VKATSETSESEPEKIGGVPMHPKRIGDPPPTFDYVGDKALKKLQRKVWDEGWFPERTKKGIRWLSPNLVNHVQLHGTASDHRAYDNAKALFRQFGVDV
jgi:hypothetical protein